MVDQSVRISLRKRLVGLHKNRRREKVVDYLRDEVAKRMHVGADDVRIDQGLNRLLQLKGRRMEDFSITLSKDGAKVVVKSAEPAHQRAIQGAAQKPAAAAAGAATQKDAKKTAEKR